MSSRDPERQHCDIRLLAFHGRNYCAVHLQICISCVRGYVLMDYIIVFDPKHISMEEIVSETNET